jgi:hypothetical protein
MTTRRSSVGSMALRDRWKASANSRDHPSLRVAVTMGASPSAGPPCGIARAG